MDNKEYHRNYYYNHYKNIIKDKTIFCNCCHVEVSAWNIWKHKNTQKHKKNSMTTEEKAKCVEEKKMQQIVKKIEKLKTQLINNSNCELDV